MAITDPYKDDERVKAFKIGLGMNPSPSGITGMKTDSPLMPKGNTTPTGMPSISQPKEQPLWSKIMPRNTLGGMILGSKTPGASTMSGLNQQMGLSNALATLARAIGPNSIGGRLGEGVLEMNQNTLGNAMATDQYDLQRAAALRQQEFENEQLASRNNLLSSLTTPPDMTGYNKTIDMLKNDATGAYGTKIAPAGIESMGSGLSPEYPAKYKAGLEDLQGAATSMVPKPMAPIERMFGDKASMALYALQSGDNSLLKNLMETNKPTELERNLKGLYGSASPETYQKFKTAGQGEKTHSEEQLTRAALREKLGREPNSQEILNAMQGRKLDIAKATAQGQIDARMSGIDVPALVDAVVQGRETVEGVKNAFGVPVQAAVQSAIAKQFPKFDFIKSDANKRYINSPQNLRIIGLVQAAYPRVESLQGKIDALQNLSPRALNMPLNALRKQFGSRAIADYESMRNAIIQEVNTALSGSSTGSDYRIQRELENLKTEATPAQLHVSVDNLLSALQSRMEASTAVPFPWEEVRGDVKFKNVDERRRFWGSQFGDNGQAAPSGNVNSIVTQLKANAKAGDKKAQDFLKSKGIAY